MVAVKMSTGSKALREALTKQSWSQNELARQLDVSSGAVSRWLKGQRIPDRKNVFMLNKLLGVPIEVWF
jgi:transcriptional regulator with XRE-family HTH domain